MQTVNHDKLEQADEFVHPDRMFTKNGENEKF